MPNELSIAERVDRLLEHGVDSPKTWAKTHGYAEPDFVSLEDWELEYRKLRLHHLDETTFLFEMLRELSTRVSR